MLRPAVCLAALVTTTIAGLAPAGLPGAHAALAQSLNCTESGRIDPNGNYECWNWSQNGGTVQPGQTFTVAHDCGANAIVISHSIHREEARLEIMGDYLENNGSRSVVVVQNVDNHFGVVWTTGRCRTRTPRLF